jgi:hypothetical protein
MGSGQGRVRFFGRHQWENLPPLVAGMGSGDMVSQKLYMKGGAGRWNITGI